MSANFYNNKGVMVGLDVHLWSTTPRAWLVEARFAHPVATHSKRTSRVTSDGERMIKGGFAVFSVPHIPIGAPVPPGPPPLVAAALVAVILGQSTKAHMQVHSVTAEGGALATCLVSAFGANANCNAPMAMPTGRVINVNSVQTSPSLGDFVAAWVDCLVTGLLNFGVSQVAKALAADFAKGVTKAILEGIVKLLFRFRKSFNRPLPIEPGDISRVVQKVVDGVAKALR